MSSFGTLLRRALPTQRTRPDDEAMDTIREDLVPLISNDMVEACELQESVGNAIDFLSRSSEGRHLNELLLRRLNADSENLFELVDELRNLLKRLTDPSDTDVLSELDDKTEELSGVITRTREHLGQADVPREEEDVD